MTLLVTKEPAIDVKRQMPSACSELVLTSGSCLSPSRHPQGASFPGAPTATLSIPPTTTPGGSPTRGCSVSTGGVTAAGRGRKAVPRSGHPDAYPLPCVLWASPCPSHFEQEERPPLSTGRSLGNSKHSGHTGGENSSGLVFESQAMVCQAVNGKQQNPTLAGLSRTHIY